MALKSLKTFLSEHNIISSWIWNEEKEKHVVIYDCLTDNNQFEILLEADYFISDEIKEIVENLDIDECVNEIYVEHNGVYDKDYIRNEVISWRDNFLCDLKNYMETNKITNTEFVG